MSQPAGTGTAKTLPGLNERVYLPARFGMLAQDVGKVASINDDWAMVDLGDYGEIGCPIADLIREVDRRQQSTPDGQQ